MKKRYQNEICLVASMHKKEEAIAPAFETHLGCRLIQGSINTDLLGTFTGEIERKLTPIECAKEKCRRTLVEDNGYLAVANEGSFGPHPLIPFVIADHELLYFVDKKLEFHLTLSKFFLKTNYDGKVIANENELINFSKKSLFPSHGLIIRPNVTKNKTYTYKGITKIEELICLFTRCSKESCDGKAWVETDMRAHMNPTRMQAIAELAQEMALRLATSCPSCQNPGWGIVNKKSGLECKECGAPTELTHSEVFGCCKCEYQKISILNIEGADPKYCPMCNP